MGFLVFFGVRDTAATRGQYLALSEAWWSCFRSLCMYAPFYDTSLYDRINEINLRQAGLVLTGEWPLYLSKPCRPTQPGHPSVGKQNA